MCAEPYAYGWVFLYITYIYIYIYFFLIEFPLTECHGEQPAPEWGGNDNGSWTWRWRHRWRWRNGRLWPSFGGEGEREERRRWWYSRVHVVIVSSPDAVRWRERCYNRRHRLNHDDVIRTPVRRAGRRTVRTHKCVTDLATCYSY